MYVSLEFDREANIRHQLNRCVSMTNGFVSCNVACHKRSKYTARKNSNVILQIPHLNSVIFLKKKNSIA